MKVKELYDFLESLIKENKGDYEVLCEGGCVGLDIDFVETWNDSKKVVL